MAKVATSAVTINLNKKGYGYIVVRASDSLQGQTIQSIADDNDPPHQIVWDPAQCPITDHSDDWKKITIRLKGMLPDPKASARTKKLAPRRTDDGSCPDGGNITVTLNPNPTDPPPVIAPVPATYTNDVPV
jgi:hypothetical protein